MKSLLTKMQRIQSRKQIIHFLGIFLASVAIVSCASSGVLNAPANQKKLVVVGGGKPIHNICMSLLEFSSIPEPDVLIIPYAAQDENREGSAQRFAEVFGDLGIEQVTVLDLDYAGQALDDINNSDLVGVGIDERTAVLYDREENRFRVMGEGTIKVLRATGPDTELERTILETGDLYQFSDNSES